MTNMQIRIPIWLDLIFAWPAIIYRQWKYGYSYRRINLGEEMYAMVEQLDYYRVKELNWCISGSENRFYAVHFKKCNTGKAIRVYMHRFIMNAPAGKLVDHHNGNKLDNRRTNLRIASRTENSCNRPKKKGTSSQYIGVYFNKKFDRCIAQIKIDGKSTHLGSFASEIEAARTYDAAAKIHHGVFARLNFPDAATVSPMEKQG